MTTTITFVVRLHKLDDGRLAFYVPKSVIKFYALKGNESILETSSIRWYKGTKNQEREPYYEEQLPDIGTKLYPHSNKNIRGVIPCWTTMPESGTLVELTLYLQEK